MCKITYERETILKNLLPSKHKRGRGPDAPPLDLHRSYLHEIK